MRIVQADGLHEIEAYRFAQAPLPEPGPGEVRIAVAVCGVGYVDALVALGRYQVKPPLPHIPGGEIAGVVDALGADVADFSVGDRVMAAVPGGFAEYVLARADQVTCLPDALAFEAAAGFRINHLTALHGLRDRADLKAGERLLVLGAAGGVGMAAVQVGRILGATVTACASTPAKRDFARAYGAHETLDTAADGWRDRLKAATGGNGPDVIFDPVCGPLFEPAFRSLSWRGRHLVVGFAGGPIPTLRANLPLMKGAGLLGVDVRQFILFEAALAQSHLAELLAWTQDGRLAPPVGRVFAFDEHREALAFALEGAGMGKTVLRVA